MHRFSDNVRQYVPDKNDCAWGAYQGRKDAALHRKYSEQVVREKIPEFPGLNIQTYATMPQCRWHDNLLGDNVKILNILLQKNRYQCSTEVVSNLRIRCNGIQEKIIQEIKLIKGAFRVTHKTSLSGNKGK